jgi:hypothetical protein
MGRVSSRGGRSKSDGYSAPGPDEYSAFFDRLADAERSLEAKKLSAQRKILSEIVNAWPVGYVNQATTGFGIVASSSLSGGRFPCNSTSCRTSVAASGARFAALYADHIMIRDPFESIVHLSADDEDYIGKSLSSISVLKVWKPLLLSGVASHLGSVCSSCAMTHVDENGAFAGSLSQLRSDLAAQFEKSSEATISMSTDDDLEIEYKVPTKYTGHRYIHYHLNPAHAGPLVRHLGKRKRRLVSKRDAARLDIFAPIYAPIVKESVLQAMYRGFVHGSYASDLQIDLDIASRTTDQNALHAQRLLRTIRHAVPVIEKVPLEVILRIRNDDDGAFQLYRSRMREMRKSLSDDQLMVEAAEALRSEYSALESRIASRRKSVWGGFRDQATIGAGTVAVGVGAWLGGILSPAWSALLSAAGGITAVQKVASDALSARRPSSEDAQSPLYFLWKLRKTVKR